MNISVAVEKLGRKRIIEVLGVTTSQVSNVISDGLFPGWWFDELDKLAAAGGWVIPRELFSWKKRRDAA